MCFRALDLPGAELGLQRDWLDARTADGLLETLLHTLAWQNHAVRMFGREIASPRLSAWIGDADASYRYSGMVRPPQPWPASLESLRSRLQRELGVPFNSVLANLYRDGSDAMGWHADDERELGPTPTIASVSLGATRRFKLRERNGDASLDIDLSHGSLLVMAGKTQSLYRHALPRTKRAVPARINLTFRHVQPGMRRT